MVSLEAREAVYERLLCDDESKDVEIEMSDGKLLAHSSILGANSDAIRGMLRHGIAGQQKRLSWREHPMEVGQFMLRLLYTGTVAEQDLRRKDELSEPEVPLCMLLGALSITKMYQVPHLIQALTDALKLRLTEDNFNDILSTAIKLDITAIRLHCLRFAEGPPRTLEDGARVRAIRLITADCAIVPVGTLGTVTKKERHARIMWENRFITTHADHLIEAVEVVDSGPVKSRLHAMYQAKELSPEVLSELSPLWGLAEPAPKVRRTL